MDKVITVQIKNIYGKEAIYPICENAKLFADLTGKKTLSRTDINKIKELGFDIQVQQDIKTL